MQDVLDDEGRDLMDLREFFDLIRIVDAREVNPGGVGLVTVNGCVSATVEGEGVVMLGGVVVDEDLDLMGVLESLVGSLVWGGSGRDVLGAVAARLDLVEEVRAWRGGLSHDLGS